MKAPPRAAEARGRDAMSVAVAKPRTFDQPAPAPREPEPVQQIAIPARSLAAAAESLPGAIEGPCGRLHRPRRARAAVAARARASAQVTDRAWAIGLRTGPRQRHGRRLLSGRQRRHRAGGISAVRLLGTRRRRCRRACKARSSSSASYRTNGICSDVRVIRSLDPRYGLDQEAMKAAGEWRFRPGTRLGQPVPVLVTMEITFTLR